MKSKTEKTLQQLEKQVERLRREKNDAEDQTKDFESKIIFLENENEQYILQNRTAESFIKDLEEKIDKTLEQLALVQTELEDNRLQTQIEVERLKQQLKGIFHKHNVFKFYEFFLFSIETEEEIQVVQNTQKKPNDVEIKTPKIINSVTKYPNYKSSNNYGNNKENEENVAVKEKKGLTHSENLKKNIENKLNEMKNIETKLNPNYSEISDPNLSTKKALEEKMKSYNSNIKSLKMNTMGFSKSLILVTGLIKDLDEKMHKIRNFKPKRII